MNIPLGIKELLETTKLSLDDICKEISIKIKGSVLVLNRPAQITVVTGATYRKVPMIGDEIFNVHSMRAGKSGLILVAGHELQTCEFTHKQASEVLDGYTDLIDAFTKNYGIDEKDLRDAAALKEKAAAIEAAVLEAELLKARMKDERFGSW